MVQQGEIIDVDSIRAGKAGTRTLVLEKLAKKTSETSAMSEGLSSNGYTADIKADMKSEADVSCQPNVSQNVSRETFTQQKIQLSADMTDMADIKKTINSRNTGKKYVDRPLPLHRPLTEPSQNKDLSISMDDVDDKNPARTRSLGTKINTNLKT